MLVKCIKSIHLCCVALWIGGVASWLPILASLDAADYESMLQGHLLMKSIAWDLIGWGGISSFVSGLVLSFVTRWRLFRSLWVTLKFFVVLGLIAFGMFYIQELMLQNLALLEEEGAVALQNPLVSQRLSQMYVAVCVDLGLFFAVVWWSVWKPFTGADERNGD